MIYKYIRLELSHKIKKLIKLIGFSIISFIFSYFIIYDPNPFYYLFTFYLPFTNFFKAMFICIFHSYILTKLDNMNTDKTNQLISTTDSNNSVQILDNEDYNDKKIDFFLSDVFYYFKQNKKRLYIFISCLILIKLIIFFYFSKLWIYFKSKAKILPITENKNIKYYITACIVNMESIIVDYIKELKKLINFLDERNVIVSIVENGDSKDNTRDYLKQFKKYLDSKLVINSFLLTHEIEDPRKQENLSEDQIKYMRIQYLAKLRNKCFDLLYQIPNLDINNIKVINFNDIIFSFEDIIKLLSTNNEDYDVVCAMDYYFNFYDIWVSIDLDGENLLDNFPYFKNKEAQDQYIYYKPIRIFSCWNGVIAFNASALKDQKLQFRDQDYSTKNTKEICHDLKGYESECTYFNIDMETLGFKKRFINPEVKVAYNYIYYYFSKYILPNTFELILYFKNYFKSLISKRNKNMSNLISMNLTYNSKLNDFYNCKKI